MQVLTSQLIQFQSTHDRPQQIQACFKFLVKKLKQAGLEVATYSSNDKPSLVAARKARKHYRYLLNGHLDVVPANYKQAFAPQVKAGRLYGRGASDMKAVVAAMTKLLMESALQEVDMALMLTSDEEVGGFNGVKYLLQEKEYSCDCVIIPDGGDNWQLVVAEKGLIHFKVTASGQAAHGSQPWLGENAITRLVRFYQKIKSQLPLTTAQNRWRPTVNLGKIQGGTATNMVPAQAEMYLDFRFPNQETQQQYLQFMQKHCQDDPNVSYEIIAQGEALVNDASNSYLQRISRVAQKQGFKLPLQKVHGASDARFFAAQDIPVIMFKPKCSQPHIDNEWIDLQSLDKFYQVLKQFLLS
jgi:succinyl-diaminopimelate desuccinylase